MTYKRGHYVKILENILRSTSSARVLLFLFARGERYPREIARFYHTAVAPIQKALARLELSGVLYSRLIGKTRLYAFNPRYALKPEIDRLLDRALTFYPPAEREKLLVNPRRPGGGRVAV